MTDCQKHITINPDQRSVQPYIRGLGITVYDVLSYLVAGNIIDEIIRNFPMQSREDILACLTYAPDTERKIRLTT